jgi:hypothetical protein
VYGDRLRFHEEPLTEVTFPGSGERESRSESERTNLPDTVAADEDYRDVTVTYRLETRLTGPPDDEADGEDGRTDR